VPDPCLLAAADKLQFFLQLPRAIDDPPDAGNERREHPTDTGRRGNGCYHNLDHVRNVVKVEFDRHAVSSVPPEDSRLAHGFQPLYARAKRFE
jgi:hypothetical protein